MLQDPYVVVERVEGTRSTAAGKRPKLSLASLIGQAILSAPEQKARLSTIYEWISERYPDYYRMNSGGWQNSIRHNLTINKAFMRLPKTDGDIAGKGAYWIINPDHYDEFKDGIFTGKIRSAEYRSAAKANSNRRMSAPDLPSSMGQGSSSSCSLPNDSFNITSSTGGRSTTRKNRKQSMKGQPYPNMAMMMPMIEGSSSDFLAGSSSAAAAQNQFNIMMGSVGGGGSGPLRGSNSFSSMLMHDSGHSSISSLIDDGYQQHAASSYQHLFSGIPSHLQTGALTIYGGDPSIGQSSYALSQPQQQQQQYCHDQMLQNMMPIICGPAVDDIADFGFNGPAPIPFMNQHQTLQQQLYQQQQQQQLDQNPANANNQQLQNSQQQPQPQNFYYPNSSMQQYGYSQQPQQQSQTAVLMPNQQQSIFMDNCSALPMISGAGIMGSNPVNLFRGSSPMSMWPPIILADIPTELAPIGIHNDEDGDADSSSQILSKGNTAAITDQNLDHRHQQSSCAYVYCPDQKSSLNHEGLLESFSAPGPVVFSGQHDSGNNHHVNEFYQTSADNGQMISTNPSPIASLLTEAISPKLTRRSKRSAGDDVDEVNDD